MVAFDSKLYIVYGNLCIIFKYTSIASLLTTFDITKFLFGSNMGLPIWATPYLIGEWWPPIKQELDTDKNHMYIRGWKLSRCRHTDVCWESRAWQSAKHKSTKPKLNTIKKSKNILDIFYVTQKMDKVQQWIKSKLRWWMPTFNRTQHTKKPIRAATMETAICGFR